MGHTASLLSDLGVALQVPDQIYAQNPPPSATGWQQVSSALSVSMHRVLVLLASFLPGVVALIIAVALFIAVGALAAWLLRKILTAARFDERVGSGASSKVVPSLQDWAPSHSPTALIARIAFWAFTLLGCIVGLFAFDTIYSGSSQMALFVLPYLTHAVGAILLLFAGNLIARFLARSVLIGAVNAQLQYARFLSLGIKWLVLVLTAAMALDHLQIGGNIVELAFGILFGGIVLTLALAVGLGSREIVSRSLERKADAVAEEPIATTSGTGETLRHF